MSNKPVKLSIPFKNSSQYVRLVQGMFPGGLTKKEMEIIIIVLHYQQQHNTEFITQEIKEKARLYFKYSSQTMHNYWHRLKQKKVILGNYKDFMFNKILSNNIELTITYDATRTD